MQEPFSHNICTIEKHFKLNVFQKFLLVKKPLYCPLSHRSNVTVITTYNVCKNIFVYINLDTEEHQGARWENAINILSTFLIGNAIEPKKSKTMLSILTNQQFNG